MSLRLAPPPVDSEWFWRRLLNRLYLYEEDELFRWAQRVRAAVEEAEREKGRAA